MPPWSIAEQHEESLMSGEKRRGMRWQAWGTTSALQDCVHQSGPPYNSIWQAMHIWIEFIESIYTNRSSLSGGIPCKTQASCCLTLHDSYNCNLDLQNAEPLRAGGDEARAERLCPAEARRGLWAPARSCQVFSCFAPSVRGMTCMPAWHHAHMYLKRHGLRSG